MSLSKYSYCMAFVNNKLETMWKFSWPNFKLLSRYLSGQTEENHEKLFYDSRSPGLDLNPGPSEYELIL
jgi:hypothetical protein